MSNLKVTATQNGTTNQIIFNWSEDLETCDYVALGIEGDELDDLLDRMMLTGTHEGNDYKGWKVKVN
jgi:hypothetical protein